MRAAHSRPRRECLLIDSHNHQFLEKDSAMSNTVKSIVSRRVLLQAAGAVSARAGLVVAGEQPPYRVGQFLLLLTRDSSAPQLKVTHVSEPQRVLWQSIPSSSFLIGGHAETEIEENDTPASGFTIKDKNLIRYEKQTVQSARMLSGALELSGTLERMGVAVGYKMTWSAAGPHQLRFAVELSGSERGSYKSDLPTLRFESRRAFLRLRSANDLLRSEMPAPPDPGAGAWRRTRHADHYRVGRKSSRTALGRLLVDD